MLKNPLKLLANCSFHWAGQFLAKQALQEATTLYSFCRQADDLVDESNDKLEAKLRLETIFTELETGITNDTLAVYFLNFSQKYQLPAFIIQDFIQTLLLDTATVRIKNETELIRYAYGVAGTVGLMMCPILGIKDKKAYAFAIDLGIAMQLTNIARDIIEDAEKDRIYLPILWFDSHIKPYDIIHNKIHIYDKVEKILQLANKYYRSADQGLIYIPQKARFAILIASRLYEAIGLKILKNKKNWHKKTVISLFEKIIITSQALLQVITIKYQKKQHNKQLHQALYDKKFL